MDGLSLSVIFNLAAALLLGVFGWVLKREIARIEEMDRTIVSIKLHAQAVDGKLELLNTLLNRLERHLDD